MFFLERNTRPMTGMQLTCSACRLQKILRNSTPIWILHAQLRIYQNVPYKSVTNIQIWTTKVLACYMVATLTTK